MNERPIIVRIATQKCIREWGDTSVIENIGVDRNGAWWRFLTDNTWREGRGHLGSAYGFMRTAKPLNEA